MRILTSSNQDNLFKIAMPVNFRPEEESAMRGEGIYPITDTEVAETNVMPNVKNRKKDIKGLFGQVSLPRITYPTAKNVIEIDGQQYYLVDVAEPQIKKNPNGTIYLMDLQTGQPVNMPFTPNADKIMSLKRDQVRASLEEVNAKIAKWNARIDKIKQVESPTTWPLQLVWATDVVDDRLAELTRMDQALTAQLDQATNLSPAYSTTIERIKGDLAAGRITNQQDIIDSVLFIHAEDPDAIPTLLESPTMPEDIKGKIRQLLGMQSDSIAKERAEDQQKEEERKGRIDVETDYGVLQPGQQPLVEIKEDDIDERAKKAPLPTPKQYFSPKGRVKSIRATLISNRRDKAELSAIRKALDGMREFIGSLSKGERANEVLSSTDKGMEIKRQVAGFLHTAGAFMRRYSVKVFVQDETTGQYSVNPKLFGTTGGKGNSEVAIVLNQIISIVTSSLKAHAARVDDLPPVENDWSGDTADMSYLTEDLP